MGDMRLGKMEKHILKELAGRDDPMFAADLAWDWHNRGKGENEWSNKFVRQIEKAFSTLPRPVDWKSFYIHDLQPYVKMDEDVKEVAIEHKLKKSQAKALQKVKDQAKPEFDKIKKSGKAKPGIMDEAIDLSELSAKEIERQVSVHKIQNQIDLLSEINAKPVYITTGEYETIVVDPPWPMQKIKREVRPNQQEFDYPVMTVDELKDFGKTVRDLVAHDTHLFLWTTQKFLPESWEVIANWGFTYILTMVWHKNGGYQPFGLPQYNAEFVVYARHGAPKFVDTKDFFCCFSGERREHSRKPDEFYNLVKRVTKGPRLDVFSREKREGFDQYGNEVGKFQE